MVLHATELRRGVDYLATRSDIDMRRLAYVAFSWGAGSRLPLVAVEDRFRTVGLIGGGGEVREEGTLPEGANPNFAPRIRHPELVFNGGDDQAHPPPTPRPPPRRRLLEPDQPR